MVVAVRQVPLAEPPARVALLAQQRAPCREARVEGAPARDHAAGLVGVEAREQRRAGGCAVVGGGVVALEGDAFAAQARDVREQPRHLRGRREPLGGAQLVHDDHQDVRAARRHARRARGLLLGGARPVRWMPRRVGGVPARGARGLRPALGELRDRGAAAREQAAREQAALQECAPVDLSFAHGCVRTPGPQGKVGQVLRASRERRVKTRCDRARPAGARSGRSSRQFAENVPTVCEKMSSDCGKSLRAPWAAGLAVADWPVCSCRSSG